MEEMKYICNLGKRKCREEFTSLTELLEHYKRDHLYSHAEGSAWRALADKMINNLKDEKRDE